MSDSLDDRFNSLARVAKELNTISDEVTDRLRAVEERLKAVGLGVEAELPERLSAIENVTDDEEILHDITLIEDAEEQGVHITEDVQGWSGVEARLGYRKLTGSWRLVVRSYECLWVLPPGDHPENGTFNPVRRTLSSERPLLDCSRDIRLAAATQIEKLLAALEQAAQKRIARLQQATRPAPAPAPDAQEDDTPALPRRRTASGAVTVRRTLTGRKAR